jgi:hypothetical protein
MILKKRSLLIRKGRIAGIVKPGFPGMTTKNKSVMVELGLDMI